MIKVDAIAVALHRIEAQLICRVFCEVCTAEYKEVKRKRGRIFKEVFRIAAIYVSSILVGWHVYCFQYGTFCTLDNNMNDSMENIGRRSTR